MKKNNHQKISEKSNDIAITVRNVSKTFRVPHRKVDSLRNAFVNIFAPNTYEEFSALNDISFKVKKGEFFGIIGCNGSGKSTLLKILAGIYRSDHGDAMINGRISPFLELGIGFNPELSGRDNVYLNATVLGLTKKEIDEKFDEIVAFAELEDFIDQQLKNYSSGMSVRLAFSVSIHANREILLMDEVLAVGDSNFQKKCIDIFRSYRGQEKTVVLVTHDIATVRKYCSKALLLHKGKIVKVGDVDEVCDEYVVKNLTTGARTEVKKNKKYESNEEGREKLLRARLKNKAHVISDISVCNEEGKELLATVRGENFSVIVDIRLKEVRENMHVAVQIFNKDTNCFVSGNSTRIDEYSHEWTIGKNIVKILFKDHHLNHGNFYVRAVLFEYKKDEHVELDEFTTLDNNYFFIAERKNAGGGLLYLEHKWSKELNIKKISKRNQNEEVMN